MITLNPLCPCGSKTPFGNCCGPFLSGKALAPTAEALMRSRYTAYCKGNVDYLLATLHPSKRRRGDRLSLAQSIQSTHWVGLRVLATRQGQPQDPTGVVEFVARYDRPVEGQLHERSRFLKEGDRWFYLDGDIAPSLRHRKNLGCGEGERWERW